MLGLVSVSSTALANPPSSETSFFARIVGLEDESGTKMPIRELPVSTNKDAK
jgi:hypothetical protein